SGSIGHSALVLNCDRNFNLSMRSTAKPLVWITGAGGLIGSYLLRTAHEPRPLESQSSAARDSSLSNSQEQTSLLPLPEGEGRGEGEAGVQTTGGDVIHLSSKFAPIDSFNVIGLTRASLDLTDSAAVRERFQNERPSLIIHCAALS